MGVEVNALRKIDMKIFDVVIASSIMILDLVAFVVAGFDSNGFDIIWLSFVYVFPRNAIIFIVFYFIRRKIRGASYIIVFLSILVVSAILLNFLR